MAIPRTRPPAALSAALVVLAILTGCSPSSTTSPTSASSSVSSSPIPTDSAAGGSLVILGRIVTMDEPAVAEAILIEN